MSLPAPVVGLEPRSEGPLLDRFARTHTYLRVSVTDRCNFRCVYCMPAEGLTWMPRDHLLTYEEITRIVRVFAGMGVRKVRLTGGEPTVRRVKTVRVRPGSATVVQGCRGSERLVGAEHAFGFFTRQAPGAALVASVDGTLSVRNGRVQVRVRGDAELGGVRAVVQVQAVCARVS